MHTLLQRLMFKRGIKDPNEMSDEEKAWFDSRQEILSKERLTVEDIFKFCEIQIDTIENKWKDLNVEQSKKAELIPYHTVYKAFLHAAKAPQEARKAIENELNNLLKI